jgi:hypothetical protein
VPLRWLAARVFQSGEHTHREHFRLLAKTGSNPDSHRVYSLRFPQSLPIICHKPPNKRPLYPVYDIHVHNRHVYLLACPRIYLRLQVRMCA